MSQQIEFWIDEEKYTDPDDNLFGYALKQHPRQGSLKYQDSLIHVIRYSKFLELAKERSECIFVIKTLRERNEELQKFCDELKSEINHEKMIMMENRR